MDWLPQGVADKIRTFYSLPAEMKQVPNIFIHTMCELYMICL